MISRDPAPYRLLMLPAIAEKLLSVGAAVWLFATRRISDVTLAPFVIDILLGALFFVSDRRAATGRPGKAAGADVTGKPSAPAH